jgi:hypothetical protein
MPPASTCSKAVYILAGILIALLGVSLAYFMAPSVFVGHTSIPASTVENSTAIEYAAHTDPPLNTGEQLANIETRLLQLETVLEDLVERHNHLAEQLDQSGSTFTAPALTNASKDNANPDLITSLINAGYTQGEALALMEKQAQVDIERQWQNYRRTFEVKQRHYEGLQGMLGTTTQDIVRQEKGDEAYDNYLVSRNLPNRLQVTRVQKLSHAEQAGIEKGDIIYSIDDHRIFRNMDIQTATHQGQPDELVKVMIKKQDGSLVSYYLPRGPFGIRNLQQVRDYEP